MSLITSKIEPCSDSSDSINMTKWFEHWFGSHENQKTHYNQVYYGICHIIGKSGVGKKTRINELIHKFNITKIDVNCLHDRSHYLMNKRTFVGEMKYMMTHRGIEYFIENKKKVIVVHNTHVLRDKRFLDEIFELSTLSGIVTPMLCIFNKDFISERLQSYISKKCNLCYIEQYSRDKIANIFLERNRGISIENIYELIDEYNGNFHQIELGWRELIFENISSKSRYFICKSSSKEDVVVDDNCMEQKNLIERSFTILCNPYVDWSTKFDIVKTNGSLLKLLMSSHICGGLDSDDELTFCDKVDIALDCIEKLVEGETLNGNMLKEHSVFLQWLYPTSRVQHITIKTMTLPNFPSTANLNKMRLYPHSPEEVLYISHFISAFLRENRTKESLKKIRQYYPYFTESFLNELCETLFKLFPGNDLTKKKTAKIFS